MASEFQLGARLFLPSQEDILPCITALYLTSSAESESESDAESEWKEAIRVALEDNLQYQVRLRLGLDPTLLHHHIQSPHTPTVLPSLTWHRGRPHITNPTTTATGENVLHCGPDEKNAATNRFKRKSQAALIDDHGPREHKHSPREHKHGPREHKHNEIQHKQPTDIFQYLSRKYGTPAEQLQCLVMTGSYRTAAESDNITGTGYNIRWPVEANIVHPTPQHVRNCELLYEPLNTHPSTTSEASPSHTSTAPPSHTSTAPPSHTSTAPPPHSMPSHRRVLYDSNSDSSNLGEPQHRRDHGVLMFESRFESGNLHQATQIGPREYNLKLRTDLYSARHIQWFYFKVENMQAGVTYTFHITNFVKKDSLYNYGMQPLLYSESEAAASGVGWKRVGHHIRYYCSSAHSSSAPSDRYTLTWRMEFPGNGDTCYLAHCYPYPYSSLMHYLNSIQHNYKRQRYVRREVLCHTLAGNPCPILTITDFDSPPDVQRSRRGVVFSARVHPGETNSSWMMQGVIDFLTSDTSHAKSLRNNYVFKLIPMLNPDGVIVGNYRTSLAGVDLNRVYKKPVEKLFPTIYHTKRMTAEFMQERELVLYVDLHGHSRKHNVFMYGCHVPQCDHTHFLNERVIPFLLSQQSPDKFCFRSCKFNVHKCKESTGRVVNWRMGVANSFTLEATFCGSTLEGHSRQFTEADLLAMGSDVCEAIHKYHKFNKSKTYEQKILSQLAEIILKSMEPRHNPTSLSVPLPDIVTSSTPRDGFTPHAQDEIKMHKKHRTKQSSKALHRFMKCDLSLLEAESSTSGSDSENDEFQYRKHKTHHQCSKHKRHRRHRSLQVQTHTQLLSQHHSMTTHPHHKPSHPAVPPGEELAPVKLHASAPARLQNTSFKKVLPTGPRFVNRYANRSNGGIPMFSEERLKERAEKERLRSLSMIQPISDQPLPQAATHEPSTETSHNPLQSTLSHKALPFLWQPTASQDQDTRTSEYEALRQRQIALSLRRKPAARADPSSLHHYQRIKGLVEGQKHRGARQLGGALYALGHAHQPHPSVDRLHGRGGLHLSPQLARYISEVWSKNSN